MPMLPRNAAIRAAKTDFAQLRPPDLGQVGQSDAHDERGFDTLAQSYDESLQHLVENSINATQLQLRTALPLR